ncbi:hypothetical protein LSAT2_008111 [Lamellibrachia satsuma]|nr:hypothetical protein LSAT2_008111 [Lamellibrachia satsuma]
MLHYCGQIDLLKRRSDKRNNFCHETVAPQLALYNSPESTQRKHPREQIIGSTMAHFKSFILAACVALSLHGSSDAIREITCLSFEKNFQGSRGVWVSHQNILRVSNDCPSGKKCARFSGLQRPYASRMSIPRFAYSFSAWRAFALSFWFKSADDKTSVLFHNNLCRDKGSLTVTVYNSGMLIAELMLQNKKTTMTVVFGSRNEWHHVAIVWTGRDVNMYMDGERRDSSPLTERRGCKTIVVALSLVAIVMCRVVSCRICPLVICLMRDSRLDLMLYTIRHLSVYNTSVRDTLRQLRVCDNKRKITSLYQHIVVTKSSWVARGKKTYYTAMLKRLGFDESDDLPIVLRYRSNTSTIFWSLGRMLDVYLRYS